MHHNPPASRHRAALSRRQFLAATAAATLPLAFPHMASRPVGSAPLGVQLYAVRDAYKADPAGTLTALAQMGYREVEFYDGIYDADMGAKRALLDQLGLTSPSGHMGIARLERDPGRAIHVARQLGHRYAIVPSLDVKATPEAYTDLAARLKRLAPGFARAGIKLGYHNHDYDLRPLEDGRTGLQILLEALPADVFAMELDLFWAKAGGGGDITRFFRQYPDHFRLVHIKDMGTDGKQVNVGAGVLDWPALLAAARAGGVEHWYAEIDDTTDQLGFARASYQYLNSISW